MKIFNNRFLFIAALYLPLLIIALIVKAVGGKAEDFESMILPYVCIYIPIMVVVRWRKSIGLSWKQCLVNFINPVANIQNTFGKAKKTNKTTE